MVGEYTRYAVSNLKFGQILYENFYSHCDRIHSSLTTHHGFDDSYNRDKDRSKKMVGEYTRYAVSNLKFGQILYENFYSHCDRIHSSLTTHHGFDDSYNREKGQGLGTIQYKVVCKSPKMHRKAY